MKDFVYSEEQVLEDQTFGRLVQLYCNAPFIKRGQPRTIGLEDELLVVNAEDGTMGNALHIIADISLLRGWKPVHDRYQPTLLIATTHEELGTVTVDAGLGTLEWNAPPCATLNHLVKLREEVLGLLFFTARSRGEIILHVGRQPITRGNKQTLVPKDRYTLFFKRFGKVFGLLGESACQQAHIDARNTHEMIVMTRVFQSASFAFFSLFGNGPIARGKVIEGWLASRTDIWDKYAPGRVGLSEYPYGSDIAWCDRLNKSEYIFGPNGSGHKLFGGAFGKTILPNDPNFETHALYHQGCIWEEARPCFNIATVEGRSPCQQPQWVGIAPIAFYLGLAERLHEAELILNRFTWTDLKLARVIASQTGLVDRIGSESIRVVVRELLDLARSGLSARNHDEEHHLDPAFQILDRGYPPAVDQINAWNKGGVGELINQFAYRV